VISSPPERVGYRQALVSRQFRALAAAQLVSLAGTSVAVVALTVLVYRRTASPLLAALTFSLEFLPYLVGGAALSSVVDRVRPRRLVTSCDAASALVAAAMAWPAMPTAAQLGLLFTIGMLSSLASGSRAALVRFTVSDGAYVPARSLLRIAGQVAQLGGNAVAGVLLLLLSPSGLFLVNAVSFAFSAIVVRTVVGDHRNPGHRPGGSTLGSLQGARVVLAHPELRRLLLIGWLVPMFAVAPEGVAAAYVAAQHAPSNLVGWWLTALPVGLIVGDIVGVRRLSPAQQRQLVAPAAAAGFAPYLVFFFDPPVQIAIPLLVASGMCGLYGLGLDARVRNAAPLPLFARTMALSSAGLMALQGLGFMLAGAIAQIASPSAAIGIAGACGTATVLVLARHELVVLGRGFQGVSSGRRAATASIDLAPKEVTATDL
jgi:hypothetical protein